MIKKLAQKEGVIYTGSAGDEPGAVMELYSFVKAMGMNVEVMSKEKNNKIDYECNPDTVLEEATRRHESKDVMCVQRRNKDNGRDDSNVQLHRTDPRCDRRTRTKDSTGNRRCQRIK